ncbi:MAG: hypothetical protein ACO398_11810, partial [Kiritimatiellia bacterium]
MKSIIHHQASTTKDVIGLIGDCVLLMTQFCPHDGIRAKKKRRSEAPALESQWREGQFEASKSKRSRFITLVHAPTKS